MHWCSRHLFIAHHTHHNKCSYTRACTPMQRCNYFFAMETISNYPRILKTSFWSMANKNIHLNHDNALAEQIFQYRACWFNTQTDCAAPARYPIQPPVFITASCCPAQETIKIHVSSLRSFGYVVAQASSDHPRWCGPHPASYSEFVIDGVITTLSVVRCSVLQCVLVL